MGVYSTIDIGNRQGQVKCWDEWADYGAGSDVPSTVGGEETYSVAMREGGYVNVFRQKIEDWTDEPRHATVIDKYGSPFTPDSRGELDGLASMADHYVFKATDALFPAEETHRTMEGNDGKA